MTHPFPASTCQRGVTALWWSQCAAGLVVAVCLWTGWLTPLASSWSAAGLGVVLMACAGLVAAIRAMDELSFSFKSAVVAPFEQQPLLGRFTRLRLRIVAASAAPGLVLGFLLSPVATLTVVSAFGVIAAAVAGTLVVPATRGIRDPSPGVPLEDHEATRSSLDVGSKATQPDRIPQIRLLTEEPDEPDDAEPGSQLSLFVPPAESELEEDAGNITQRVVRRQTDEQRETLEGSIRVAFASRQKQAFLHVPFVPPFDVVPEFDASLEGDDSAVRLKVAAVFRYGARVELRRVEAGDSLTVDVFVEGSAPLRASRAA